MNQLQRQSENLQAVKNEDLAINTLDENSILQAIKRLPY